MTRHWIKLYTRLLTDPTLRRWPVGQRYCWIGTLLIAAEASQSGALVDAAGHPLTDSDLAAMLGVSRWTATHFRQRAVAARMLTVREDGALVVHNFERLQAMSVSRRYLVGNPSVADTHTYKDRAHVSSEAEAEDVTLSSAKGPAALTFEQSTGLSAGDAHAVAARLAHSDGRTAAALMSVSKGLPNAAIAGALELLELRRGRPPVLVSDAKYLVHVLREKRRELVA